MAQINWKTNEQTDKEFSEYQRQIEIDKLKSYLADTDFYYARQLETKEPVPPEVIKKRIEVRNKLRELGL